MPGAILINTNRQTGRTQRMLTEVFAKVLNSEHVVVVARRAGDIPSLQERFLDHFIAYLGKPKQRTCDRFEFQDLGTVKFISYRNVDFDLKTGTVWGHDGPVFIDHTVLDYDYSWLLNRWLDQVRVDE